jgi:hypothetical protein
MIMALLLGHAFVAADRPPVQVHHFAGRMGVGEDQSPPFPISALLRLVG